MRRRAPRCCSARRRPPGAARRSAELRVDGRAGLTGARSEGTIGFASLRGGSVAGDHQVIFAGEGERIELGHRAEDRVDLRARRGHRGAVARRQARRALHDGRGAGLAREEGRHRRILRAPRRRRIRIRRPSSSRAIPTSCSSRSCCRRRRPTSGVNKATRALFAEVDDARADGRARRGGAESSTSRRSACSTPRRRTSSRCREALIDDHGGEVPADRDALEALPGVGRKTANVVMNVAFGAETFAVDTHIFRVGNRTGLARGKTPLAVERKLDKADAAAVPPPRAPLADPARPLCLQGAHARMLALHRRRSVRATSPRPRRRRTRRPKSRCARPSPLDRTKAGIPAPPLLARAAKHP